MPVEPLFTLHQYLLSLSDTRGLLRTLGEIEVCRDERGQMYYGVGNSAVVFRVRHAGSIRSLRCYLRPMRHLEAIYGEKFLREELYLYTSPETGVWVDVVLGDWIEGVTLHEAIREAALAGDVPRLSALSPAFDRLAAELVADDAAHGDLKPENIIVDAQGTLRLIDLDASFLPAFASQTSPELGTAAYQHPARTAKDFDASLDDYPAALISTALHALTLDPGLYARYRNADGLLYTPQRIRTDAALQETLALFERAGMATQYRIAELLLSPTPRLYGFGELLRHMISTPEVNHAAVPELFARDGRWGYRDAEQVIVPPLYDCGFDFSEGLAAVRLHQSWHYIDASGRTAISCPACEAVKPFRNGRAVIVRNGRRSEIDSSGHAI